MNKLLTITERNNVLTTMAELIRQEKEAIIKENKKDLEAYDGGDLAMEDRLKVDEEKIQVMITALNELTAKEDPLGKERFHFQHENGMHVYNKTAPFGTVMIIYESRPDVTVEAAGIAFKSGNKILLKGGKESLNSNLQIVELWHQALKENDISTGWVEYLNYDRKQTQAFLENPSQKVDLVVPRGGEKLIAFVKQNSSCPVIVSGRGNNFVYVHEGADTDLALKVILNAKTTKISACNAVDKILIDSAIPNRNAFIDELHDKLSEHNIEIMADASLQDRQDVKSIESEE